MVLISHDSRRALDVVVDLVNSAPVGDQPDGLSDAQALKAFMSRHHIGATELPGEQHVAAVVLLRERLSRVFSARDDRAAALIVNELVATGATPRLTDHDGHSWHMHYFAPGCALADYLAANCGMALASLIVAGERSRLCHCQAPDCRQVFVDLSRNRSRRYCDGRGCGNRLHVAAYRARRREAETEAG